MEIRSLPLFFHQIWTSDGRAIFSYVEWQGFLQRDGISRNADSSGCHSLMRSDNVLCFICASVAQCWSVTMYWLLQTDFVDTVRWSCSSSAI